MHAYIHTYMHTYVRVCVRACVRAYVRTYVHTYGDTIIQLCTYVRTHIHTCIHTLTMKCLWSMRHNNDYKTTLSIEYICLGDTIMLCKIRSWGASMEVNIYRPFYVIIFLFFFKPDAFIYTNIHLRILTNSNQWSLVPALFQNIRSTKHIILLQIVRRCIPGHQLPLNQFPEGVESQIL